MANWDLPTINSLYTDVISDLKSRDEDSATMFRVAPINPVTNTIRWEPTNSRFEIWSGAAWGALDTEYAINVTTFDGQLSSYYTNASNLDSGILPAGRFNDTTHGARGGGTLHSAATTSANGFMSSTDKTKLNGIESGATADQTAAEILTAIKTVDGASSGLDADLLDGEQGSSYVRSNTAQTISSVHTYTAIPEFNGGDASNPPLNVDSSFLVSNLNADLLDGNHATAFATSGHTHSDATTGTSGFMSSTDKSKLNGIESGATADQTAAEILTAIKTVDGASSGLDADLLDGIEGSDYLRSNANDNFTSGTLTFNSGTTLSLASGATCAFANTTGTAPFTVASTTKVTNLNVDLLDGLSSDQFEPAFTKNTAFNDNYGTTAGTVCQGNDSRLSDARTPIAHDTHANLYPSSDNSGVVGSAALTWNNGQFTNLTIDSILSVRGAIDLADSDILRLGSSDDWEFFHNGTHNYTDINVGDWYVRSGTTSKYLYDVSLGDFHADGDIIAYSTSVSDENEKYDISVIENAIDKVKQLRGVEFNYKKNDRRGAGVIAQDVEKVLPQAVHEKRKLAEENSEETYKTVNYDALHGILIECIKELTTRVEELEIKCK